MENLLKALLIIVSSALIILILLQGGKTDAMSAFTGNSGLSLFASHKERGSEKLISRSTYILAAAFFVLVFTNCILQ